jgi:hypothetical protein
MLKSLQEKRKCLNCRKRLAVRELRKNLIVQDLLNTQEDSVVNRPANPQVEESKCPDHEDKISMYCVECEKYICTE